MVLDRNVVQCAILLGERNQMKRGAVNSLVLIPGGSPGQAGYKPVVSMLGSVQKYM